MNEDLLNTDPRYYDNAGDRHFQNGRCYRATLKAVERVPSHIGGSTATYAKFRFDVAGYPIYYNAALPSAHIPLSKCTKLLTALNALGWSSPMKLPELIGRPVWLKVVWTQYSETVETLSAEVEL